MVPRRSRHPAILLLALLAGPPGVAGAKDLPRGAAASHAVGPCETFGPGYTQVPGSQICVRISGSVAIESTIFSGGTRGVGAFMSAPRR